MGVRRALLNNNVLKEHVRSAVASFGGVAHSDRIDKGAEKNAWEVDKVFEDSWADNSGVSAIMNICDQRSVLDFLQSTEYTAVNLEGIDEVSQRIIHQLPGVQFDLPSVDDSKRFPRQIFELFGDPLKLRLITCRRLLDKFYICRDYLIYGEVPTSDQGQVINKTFWPKNLLQRQLWRLQDLCDGGGLGFAVELFLLSLKQLLSTSASHESYSQLYTITLKTITSDWREYKHSLGTQKLLLDAIASRQGFVHGFKYPKYITDELWELLADILEGQTGSHIRSAVQQLTDHQMEDHKYGPKVEAVISRLRASCSQEPSNPTA
jgi:hypothetical protein